MITAAIFPAIALLVFLLIAAITHNDKDEIHILCVVIFFLLLAIAVEILKVDGRYRQGQIDALTGNVKYELVTQPDSTRVWKRI